MKLTREEKGIISARQAKQQMILDKYGEDAVEEARIRLCETCLCPCGGFLYALTLDGSDCPYYAKKKGAKAWKKPRR